MCPPTQSALFDQLFEQLSAPTPVFILRIHSVVIVEDEHSDSDEVQDSDSDLDYGYDSE